MNRRKARDSGAILLLATLLLMAAAAFVLVIAFASSNPEDARRRATEGALAEAREALLAYAASRAINETVGPGYLPCPDLDNDGWAETTCGSLAGDVGQDERLGRLPWKTLGIADLRDGDGERLWYAVSTKHKGLLNCAASAACIDMSPDAALGTITVRDSTGALVHDGTLREPYRASEGGAVAVVIAPGPPLMRIEAGGETGRMQLRACGPGDCDEHGRCLTDPPRRAATCDPANYLDMAPAARFAFEDNSNFVDRGSNGFLQGPVVVADGRVAVNDRVLAIGYRDWIARVMQRVALEVATCVGVHRSALGRYPPPVPLCTQKSSIAWTGVEDASFGRLADAKWDYACNIATDAAHSWWKAWRDHVFYARMPGSLDVVDMDGRVVARGRDAAVIVAGPPLVRDGFVQHHDDATRGEIGQWLEASNARLESALGCAIPPPFGCEAAGTCTRITQDLPRPGFNDVVVAIP